MPDVHTLPSSFENEADNTVVKIFESLRDRIVSGDIAPGSLINSVELAQDFGSSRTPVREALLILSQHGLLNLSARRRPRVANVTVQAIGELYDLRSALHHHIADAVVRHASDAALAQLHEEALALTQDFDERGVEAHLRAVERFLAHEASLAGNALILEVLDSLKWRIAWFRRLGGSTREALQLAAKDRVRVTQAYLDRDARLAQAMSLSMLRRASLACQQGFGRSLPADERRAAPD